MYNFEKEWTKAYANNSMEFPAEYLIRIFKGSYPNLTLRDSGYTGKKVCDVGCGDGRNFVMLNQCGLELYGVEVAQSIVDKVKINLELNHIPATVKVGTNDKLDFESEFFDYLISWNSCYYMGDNRTMDAYVNEFARVMKSEGYLVLSIPKKTCFIYKGAEALDSEYVTIKNDPFNVRNGERLRMFSDENDIVNTFSGHFKNFIFGSIEDDCFGFDYHWHLVVCQKK